MSCGWHSCRVKVRRSGVWVLLALYVMVTIATIVGWSQRGMYPFSGDEPHYLVIADALWTDRTADVAVAYEREFSLRQWYPPGLADPGAVLQPPYAHVVDPAQTPNGVFSWHGVGVGALLAVPVGLVGGWIAPWLMAAFGALVLLLAWIEGAGLRRRVLLVASVALAYPLLLAGTQVFPDLPAGALLLAGLVWLGRASARVRPGWTVAAASAVALAPWLGIKFAPATAVVLVGMLVARWPAGRGKVLPIVIPAAVSAVGLMAFHAWAYGSILGPPTDGTLAFGRDFLLVLPGLLLDQNQGLLWANPMLWVGIAGIAVLWASQRLRAVVWSLGVLALWIPGAAHPGLYGVGSFNGRYAWGMAVLMVIPALAALRALQERFPRAVVVLAVGALVFQGYLVALSVLVGGSAPGLPAGLDLYTRPAGTWLESYSAWWFPLQGFLPAWYDPSWAFGFTPNYVWLVVLLAVFGLGVLLARRGIDRLSRRGCAIGGAFIGVVVLLAGLLSAPGPRYTEVATDAVLDPSVDAAGFAPVQLPHLMRSGPYTWGVTYSSALPDIDVVGKWELVRALDGEVVAAGELTGTGGEVSTVAASVPYRSVQPREFVLRIGWYGNAPMQVKSLFVQHG